MQTPLLNTQKFNFDDYTTFTERIKKNTQRSVDKMQNNMNLKMASFENKIEKQNIAIENKMNIIENKIDTVEDKMG